MSLSKKLTTSKDQRDLETESMDTIYDFFVQVGHLVKIIIFSLYPVRPQSLSFIKLLREPSQRLQNSDIQSHFSVLQIG